MEWGTYLSAGEYRWRHRPLWFHTAGLQETASGYGKRLRSTREVFVGGRWRRVYITIFSNSGTAWIVLKGVKRPIADSQFGTEDAEGD